jgi:hypothetical protein
MHRPQLGITALALLLLAGVLHFTAPLESPAIEYALWRVGAVAALAWLAYPQLAALPGWLLVAGGAGLLIAAWRPRALWVLAPLLAVLLVLRPRRRP